MIFIDNLNHVAMFDVGRYVMDWRFGSVRCWLRWRQRSRKVMTNVNAVRSLKRVGVTISEPSALTVASTARLQSRSVTSSNKWIDESLYEWSRLEEWKRRDGRDRVTRLSGAGCCCCCCCNWLTYITSLVTAPSVSLEVQLKTQDQKMTDLMYYADGKQHYRQQI